MNNNIGIERCLSFINLQLSPGNRAATDSRIRPAITISRMAGAGGHTVAEGLAEYLKTKAPGDAPWTVFDRKLVEQVLEDHHLSKRIAEFMPENHKSMLTDIFEELLGLHPSSWTLVQQTAQTILHLAELGNVILVGRGANVVTSKLHNVLRVRLVGSVEKRTEWAQQVYKIDRQAASEFLKREDRGRRRYLKEHFHEDIDNPLLYDLIINTDRTHHEDVVRLVGDEVMHRFHLERPVVGKDN